MLSICRVERYAKKDEGQQDVIDQPVPGEVIEICRQRNTGENSNRMLYCYSHNLDEALKRIENTFSDKI